MANNNSCSMLTPGHNYTKRELLWHAMEYQELARFYSWRARRLYTRGIYRACKQYQQSAANFAHAANFFREQAEHFD
jgi:hypothetical protein